MLPKVYMKPGLSYIKKKINHKSKAPDIPSTNHSISLTLNNHCYETLQLQQVSWLWCSTTAVAETWGMDSVCTCWLLEASACVTSELLYTCWPHPCQPPLFSPLLLFTLPSWLKHICNTECFRADICIKVTFFAWMHFYSMCIEWESQLPSRKTKDPLMLGGVEGGREQWACDWLGRDTTCRCGPLAAPGSPTVQLLQQHTPEYSS